ncbi:cell division protein ZipA C-terminal FtsZ-binding domain-containing protein [Gammaproteobacteria bacterium]|nr:cell division protein ZipA C-terminal FtsZ-binding domain-containing protein [Gammaproteobacteria bacterium]
MLELRWVLLSLGLLLVAGVYLWSYFLSKKQSKPSLTQLNQVVESSLTSETSPNDSHIENIATKEEDELFSKKIVTLRFVPKNNEELDLEQTVLALRNAGLQRGKYGIFHYFLDKGADDKEAEFSVANLIEPGSFDLSDIKGNVIPGMTFFMELPGCGDPIARFDRMVSIARDLKQILAAELLDEEGSHWSIQRERYIREEIIEYYHQHKRIFL